MRLFKILGKKSRYGKEIQNFEKYTIRHSYNELCHLLDNPITTTANEIVKKSDSIVKSLSNIVRDTRELELDAEWFLISQAFKIDFRRLIFVTNEDLYQRLHNWTGRMIALKICQVREVNNGIDERLIRTSKNRKELLDELGIEYPTYYLREKDPLKLFLAFVSIYYLRESNYERFIYSAITSEIRDIFRKWKDQCFENHYYFLCAMDSPIGEYMRGYISKHEMNRALKKEYKP